MLPQLKGYSARGSGENAGGRPDDETLYGMLAELNTTPGLAPSSTSIAAVKNWTRTQEEEDIMAVLRFHTPGEIVERAERF